MTTSRVPQGAPERAALPATAAAADQWTSVGPAVVIRGQAAGRPRVAGRVVALAVSDDGLRIYAGTALGGVWYSGDGGAHWMALDFYSSTRDAGNALQHADALTVGAIAVKPAPTAPSAATDVVYVGAGEHPALGAESATLAAVGIRRAEGPVTAIAPTSGAFVGAAAGDPWRVESPSLAGLAVNDLAIDRLVDGVVWAATSGGLYKRTPGAGANPPHWDRIDTPLTGEASAVVALPGAAAGQQVLYVAAVGGGVARCVNGVDWQAVALPAFPDSEVVPGTSIGHVRLAPGNVPNQRIVYALADGPRLWRINEASAQTVLGLPLAISEADREALAPFKLAIAVHPMSDAAHQDVIAVGGQTFGFPAAGDRQAALFAGPVRLVSGQYRFQRAAVAAGAPPAEWIGSGVPSGVQVLRWIAPPASPPSLIPPPQLWVGGDGGVFRSTADGARGSFEERNTGLGAIELVSLAQASDADAVMIAGTRTSGLLRRRSNETWEVVHHGRVGGVAIDPANPRRMYAQRTRMAWRFTEDAGATPFRDLVFWQDNPGRQALWAAARDREDQASAATSRMGLIAVAGSRRGTQRALGTDRVWYTDDERLLAARDAGGSASGWVTLPSLTNPYNADLAGAPLVDQDSLQSAVLATQWGAEDRLYVLTDKFVYLLERNADLSWKLPDKLYDAVAVQNATKSSAVADQIPYQLPRLSLAVHQVQTGKGTLYVGTSGPSDKHHVWWYDGAGRWRDTGFAVDTPVRVIVVDPDHREVVFLGTERGVYRGTGSFPTGADPTWSWMLYSTGLPGAPCVDLAIYAPPWATRRLLRAALAGHGVWEVLLDSVQQGPEVYLRSHAYDARRLEVPVGGPRDRLSATSLQVPLDASPDIRVWRTPSTPPPEALSYAINAQSDPFDLWRMLSGLRAAGEDVDPDAGWVATTAAALEHRRAIVMANVVVPPTDQEFWERLLVHNPLPHDRTPPDHADLVSYMRDEPDRWPKGFRTSAVSGDGTARIFVTVHTRHWRRISDNTVSVALLKTPFARRHSLAGTRALPPGWGASLVADRAIASWPGTSPAWMANTEWSYADVANPFRRITGTFDPHNPQFVWFDAVLTGSDTWNKPGWLLLAVVLDGDPPATETDVARLVRTDRRVAARSVRRALLPGTTTSTRLAGLDKKTYPGVDAMNLVWSSTNFMFTGWYFSRLRLHAGELDPATKTALPAPPPPYTSPAFNSGQFIVNATNTGHPSTPVLDPFRGHVDASWTTRWAEIVPDLGVLPIYFGHQDPRNVEWDTNVTPQGWRPKGPFDLRDVVALDNADDAKGKAQAAGVPVGAVIYLDWEYPSLDWVLNTGSGTMVASAEAYCLAFLRTLAGFGYRPGVYCRPDVATVLRGLCPGLFFWNPASANPRPASPTVLVTKNGGPHRVSDTATPLSQISPGTIARQWRLDIHVPAPPVEFDVDLNVAIVHDPSFPERRMVTSAIVGGRTTAASTGGDTCAIYTVRGGRPVRASGAIGALARDRDSDLVSDDIKMSWNPLSTPAALRVPGPAADPDPADMMIALGSAEREGDEVWRLQALRHRVTAPNAPRAPWQLETIPDAGLVIDPLPGVVATTRGDSSIDVFAVVNDSVRFDAHGTLAVARRSATTHAWSTLTAIPGATARRTNRPGAASRAPGVADVVWADGGGRLMAASSAAATPATWTAGAQIGASTVVVHPLSNIVVVARNATRGDALFLGCVGPVPPANGAPAVWRLYNVRWISSAWQTTARMADSLTVPIEALSSIAACRRTDSLLDVFFVGQANGALYVVTLNYTGDTWGAPLLIGTAPAGFDRLSSIDSACSDGTGAAQVIATSRDGNLWATSRAATDTGYGALVPLRTILPL